MDTKPSLSIFWVSVDKVHPNPLQPRHEFDSNKLKDLSASIHQYGVLQPLVVTKKDLMNESGDMQIQYELIAGERRLRASKMAGLREVPVLIRSGEEERHMKLELAIVENLQREDLNPVDRAKAFNQLADEFSLKQSEIARRFGKSREYIANSIRLLSLPESMITALHDGKISEGHARSLLMLCDKPEEQETLFNDVVFRRLTVREAERCARKIAIHKVRKQTRDLSPDIIALEEKMEHSLGANVHIEKRGLVGGRITIDFNNEEDLQNIIQRVSSQTSDSKDGDIEYVETNENPLGEEKVVTPQKEDYTDDADTTPAKKKDDLYTFKNFSL